MPNITQFPIPALPISLISPLPSAALTDILVADQSGSTGTETLAQILALFLPNLFLSFNGNPNGNVAGTVNQLCYDTLHQLLYVCTVSGSITGAVWRPCIPSQLTGQLLIGSTGNPPVAATLTAGTGITIINAPGSITISGSASGISWNNVTDGSATMASNNGYICNNPSGSTALTLPTTSSLGDVIYIEGILTGWSIAQNIGQTIFVSPIATSTGVGGSLASTNARDSVLLICVNANTEWNLSYQQSAGLTIV